MRKVVKVYFSALAEILDVSWNADTSAVLHQLACWDGVYHCCQTSSHEVLRPHVIDKPSF